MGVGNQKEFDQFEVKFKKKTSTRYCFPSIINISNFACLYCVRVHVGHLCMLVVLHGRFNDEISDHLNILNDVHGLPRHIFSRTKTALVLQHQISEKSMSEC